MINFNMWMEAASSPVDIWRLEYRVQDMEAIEGEDGYIKDSLFTKDGDVIKLLGQVPYMDPEAAAEIKTEYLDELGPGEDETNYAWEAPGRRLHIYMRTNKDNANIREYDINIEPSRKHDLPEMFIHLEHLPMERGLIKQRVKRAIQDFLSDADEAELVRVLEFLGGTKAVRDALRSDA